MSGATVGALVAMVPALAFAALKQRSANSQGGYMVPAALIVGAGTMVGSWVGAFDGWRVGAKHQEWTEQHLKGLVESGKLQTIDDIVNHPVPDHLKRQSVYKVVGGTTLGAITGALGLSAPSHFALERQSKHVRANIRADYGVDFLDEIPGRTERTAAYERISSATAPLEKQRQQRIKLGAALGATAGAIGAVVTEGTARQAIADEYVTYADKLLKEKQAAPSAERNR